MSSLLLPKASSASLALSTPLNKKAKGAYDAQNSQDNEEWVSGSSAVKWSTPRKMKDLGDQLHLYIQLEQSIATQRQLFRKVKKGFQEQSMELATAQHQIQLLQAQVNNSITRKRKAVHIDPNTKFATISDKDNKVSPKAAKNCIRIPVCCFNLNGYHDCDICIRFSREKESTGSASSLGFPHTIPRYSLLK
ncbi:hypothetical protein CGCF413_v004528 [Colletotrichum fructicola]|nr:hypothetical protein CGCF413_v004528 [Colletotrichum fructicola]